MEGTNDLERHYKTTEKQKRVLIESKRTEEEKKRLLRCTCSPEEALQMVADDMRKKKSEREDIIREGYVIREDAMDIKEKKKDKFRNKYLKVAEHGIIERTNLGPTLENEVEEIMTKYQDQVVFNDKISFFRMEYLLYCLRELYDIDQDTYYLKEDVSHYKKKIAEKDAEIQKLRFNYARATYEEKSQLEKLQQDWTRLRSKLQIIDSELNSKKNVIRKLIDHILRWRVKAKKVYSGDYYGVPLSTYWLPLDFLEDIDTDYDQEQYRLNLVEKIKKKIANDDMKVKDPRILQLAVEDMTEDAKHRRTALGYYEYADPHEELVFKKLEPLTEKTSNEILSVVPEKIRETFRNL